MPGPVVEQRIREAQLRRVGPQQKPAEKAEFAEERERRRERRQ